MADINHVISLGIGSPAAIAEFITFGLQIGDEIAPPAQVEQPSGGFFFDFDAHVQRRRKRQQELDEIEEEQERIKDAADREIARLLQIQERKDAERKDLERIKALVKRYESVSPVEINSERVQSALKAAQQKQSIANLERLQREFQRMVDEEEAFMSLLLVLANE